MAELPHITSRDIEQIIKEVGFPCRDRKGLAQALNYRVFAFSCVWKQRLPNKRQTNGRRMKEKVHLEEAQDEGIEAISKVSCMLKYYKNVMGTTATKQGVIILEDLRTTLLTDIEERKETISLLQILDNKPSSKHITNLMGKILPEIYEGFFDRKWGASRPPNGGELNGPSIRFAQFILCKLDLKRTPEAIYSAYPKRSKQLHTKK